MASRASRDKRIAAADKKIEAAAVRKRKGEELIAEADEVIRKAEADKEWLRGMPVDDDEQPEETVADDAPIAPADLEAATPDDADLLVTEDEAAAAVRA